MKIIYLCIALFFLAVPGSAETLEYSGSGVKVYSGVNDSWDYSARYELTHVRETEGSTSYSISYAYDVYTMKFYEYLKPTDMCINFNLNTGLKKVVAQSNYVASPSFVEGTSFNLMDGDTSVGYGSFFMWANSDNADKLLYYFEFEHLEELTGIGTYSILYGDDTIFDSLPLEYQISSSNKERGYVSPNGDGVYLKSMHHSMVKRYHSGSPWTSAYSVYDEMATTNTITNEFISDNDILYYYNVDSFIGYTEIKNYEGSYRLGLTHNFTSYNTETSNDYYIFDSAYTTGNQLHNSQRLSGVKFDLYTDSTKSTHDNSYILDWGGPYRGRTGYYDESRLIKFVDSHAGYYYSGETLKIETDVSDYWGSHSNEVFDLHILINNSTSSAGSSYHKITNLTWDKVLTAWKPYTSTDVECDLTAYITYSYSDPATNSTLYPWATSHMYPYGYIPEPDEPEIPDFPDNETELPDPPDDPYVPGDIPNGTGANESINVSWTGQYYQDVDDTVGGLCSPIYNFTGWLLSPVDSLNTSISEFNGVLNESLVSAGSGMDGLSGSIFVVLDAFPNKIKGMVTFFLVMIVFLVIMKG